MNTALKSNWQQSQIRFANWWQHKGLIIGYCGEPVLWQERQSLAVQRPNDPESYWTDPSWRAAYNHRQVSNQSYPFDFVPLANVDLGPGSLALMLGSRPGYSFETVWFHPGPDNLEQKALYFDKDHPAWETHAHIIHACVAASQSEYYIGCPDLVENLDTLASLIGTQEALMALLEKPTWVREKIAQINQAYFEVYDCIYRLIKHSDGSSCYGAYKLWAPGKVAKVQCDISSMIAPETFRETVLPSLVEQCDWLDYALYHLDGSQCICHLDALLEISSLHAIEWTPEPGMPPGGSSHWYDLYRRILAAGKSVQAVRVRPDEVVPMIEALGPDGLYLHVHFRDARQVDDLMDTLAKKGYYTD